VRRIGGRTDPFANFSAPAGAGIARWRSTDDAPATNEGRASPRYRRTHLSAELHHTCPLDWESATCAAALSILSAIGQTCAIDHRQPFAVVLPVSAR